MVTPEEFDALIFQSDDDSILELIGAEVVQKDTGPYYSYLAVIIATAIVNHILPKKLGHVTGEAGGYQVQGERYAPDVAFISNVKQPKLARGGYYPNPPDLAVEVVSPNDRKQKLTIKISNYLAAGTVVWVVYPDTKEVQIHAPGQTVQVLTTTDILDGGSVLPDFKLAVSDIFPNDENE
jgi:Uma2 family endonuclease